VRQNELTQQSQDLNSHLTGRAGIKSCSFNGGLVKKQISITKQRGKVCAQDSQQGALAAVALLKQQSFKKEASFSASNTTTTTHQTNPS
jgi:hypothetical protein